jgi:hypothetical protein
MYVLTLAADGGLSHLPVIVVGGSNKSCGKTSLICGIIGAFPDFKWTAVKITSHRYGQVDPVWEESKSGRATDTARYLAAGAHRAFLVRASETALPLTEMQAALSKEPNVIYESNRIAEEIRPDICLALTSGAEAGFKLSFVPFLNVADAVIAPPGAEIVLPAGRAGVAVFRQSSQSRISPELIEWLRGRSRN